MATTRKDLRLRIGGPGYCGDLVGDSTNEIHAAFPPDDKNDAINDAILLSHNKWLRHIENEALTIVVDTYRYRIDNLTVPVDRTLGIDDVWYHESGEAEYYRVDPNTWSVADSAGMLYLEFDTEGLPATGCIPRLHYRARPSTLSADTSTLTPDETTFSDFICAKATGLLFQQKVNLAGVANALPSALALWITRANEFNALAEQCSGLRFHVAPKRPATRSGW
jgi:hypothetical protein